MKLTYFQLDTHLAKTLALIYLVGGDEVLLKQDSLRSIQTAAQKAGFIEKIRLKTDTELSEHLYHTLYSSSLFSEKRLIELELSSLSNKAVTTILQEYANNPSSEQLLLIQTGKIDTKTTKNTCYQSLEKAGIVVALWPFSREQLLQWIHQQAKKYRLQFNPLAASLLADLSEGNLIATSQTIEKCYLLHPQKLIDKNLIETLMTDEAQFSIYDLVDSLIANNLPRSLHVLSVLKFNHTEPTLIIWAIARELRLLNLMLQQISKGLSYDEIFKSHSVFIRRQPIIKKFLSKINTNDCWHFLNRIVEMDRCVKGAHTEHFWNQLQLLCLKMATFH